MITRHRQAGALFVVTGAQLNAIADALDRDVPLAGQGLSFTQAANGRTFFVQGAGGTAGPTGVEARSPLPAQPDPQVVPGRVLNAILAQIRSQRGFAGSGVGMKSGSRGRIFSVASPFWTPPFPPPPDPDPDPSDGSGSDPSSGSGSGSGSGGGGGGPDPDPDSSSSSSSGS